MYPPCHRLGLPNYSNDDVTVDVSQGRTLINKPYIQVDYQWATYNSSGTSPDGGNSTVTFDGEPKVRTITDLGEFQANFPQGSSDSSNGSDGFPDNDKRKRNKISVPDTNI